MLQQSNKILIAAGFIQFVEEVTWLSQIIVVPKKNRKLRIYINFKKLNAATKKDPYPLLLIDEILNIITWYEAFFFYMGIQDIIKYL
jgi:hypothetical protein